VYELTVTLMNTEHLFWRRFQIKSNIGYYQLHLQLQCVLGWRNETPFRFQVGDILFVDPEDTFTTLPNEKNARTQKVCDTVTDVGQKFFYEYDPVSKWQHEIELVKIQNPATCKKLLPHCLEGKNSRPPENFGGIKKFNKLAKDFIPGVSRLVEYIDFGNGNKHEHAWDPFHFNLKETNLGLDYTFNFKSVKER
jgi:hypothetical protein